MRSAIPPLLNSLHGVVLSYAQGQFYLYISNFIQLSHRFAGTNRHKKRLHHSKYPTSIVISVSLTGYGSLLIIIKLYNYSRVAGIAQWYSAGLRDGRSVVRFPAGVGIFLLTTASRSALRPTQPLIQWVPGALSLGVKQPGREADHSLPSSVDVKNACSYTSTPNTPSWRGAQ
jgi:hypothetical protein